MSETYNVAVVGSGPAGFYTAEALLQSDLNIRLDMIERLPVPFGLVRHGVAPDHQRLKAVTALFETIANHENFAFFGNLHLGRDIKISDLLAAYDAVVIATGASSDRPLGIDGEALAGSVSASEFVAWYNGHPDFRDRTFDLSHPNAVIVGNGNVALDVCRILSKTVDELKHSDICEHALDALAASRVRNIYLVGRRGPVQAKFTTKELREFGELDDAEAAIDQGDFDLNDASVEELASPEGSGAAKNLEIFRSFAPQAGKHRKSKHVHFRFLLSPLRVLGRGHVERVVFEKVRLSGAAFRQGVEPTGEEIGIPAGLLVRSVGYRGIAIPGVPFDCRSGTIPNKHGRVQETDGTIVPRLYVAGWIKRGPSGVIGTNRACGVDSSLAVLADLQPSGNPPSSLRHGRRERLLQSLRRQPLKIVDFAGWLRIDALERSAGAVRGKPREKMTSVQAMLDAADQEIPLASCAV
jgi:ferredoxin/flavodoxin---NADP+ reductase